MTDREEIILLVTFAFLWLGKQSFYFLVNSINSRGICQIIQNRFLRWGWRWRIWWRRRWIAWRRGSGGASSSPPASPSSPASPAFSSLEHSTLSFAKRWEKNYTNWIYFCWSCGKEKYGKGGRENSSSFWLDAPTVQMQEEKKEGGTKRPICISTFCLSPRIQEKEFSANQSAWKIK